MERIRLFLVDDEPDVRRGLRMRLEMEHDFRVVGEAGDGPIAIAAIEATRPDVVLMDIEMPRANGIDLTAQLRTALPYAGVVIVSMQDDAATRARAFAAGAGAFVGKHEIDSRLTGAIRSVASCTRGRTVRGSRIDGQKDSQGIGGDGSDREGTLE